MRTCKTSNSLPRLLVTLGLALGAPGVVAQQLPVGATTTNAALTALYQFDTDLDTGGDFRWYEAVATLGTLHQVSSTFALGATLRYEYQKWTFGQPAAFGGAAPWGTLNQPQFSAAFIFTPAPEWQVVVAPTVEWAYESGASKGDAVIYGAIATASRQFSPTLKLGLGVGAFRELFDSRVFPFLVVDWKINDQWRLTNPLPAGPAGGAGLELVHTANDRWQVGFGGAYRKNQFRLAQDNPVPNGIGENTFYPVFLRAGYQIGAQSKLDFYVAALVNGKLTVKNSQGDDLTNDDYDVAPAVGLSFQHRF